MENRICTLRPQILDLERLSLAVQQMNMMQEGPGDEESEGKQKPRSPGKDSQLDEIDNIPVKPPLFTKNLKAWLVGEVDKKRAKYSAGDAVGAVVRETGLQFSRTSYYMWKMEHT